MSSGKLSFLILLLFLISAVLLAGCIQPPTPDLQENTSVNISAVERDPVRETAAEAAHFPKDASDGLKRLPPFPEYYAFLNASENRTYYNYLVHTYPRAYEMYRNSSLNMSYIAYLERTLSGYPFTLNHDHNYIPLRFDEIADIGPSVPVIHLTSEEISENSLLRFEFIETNHSGLKVLPSEEWLLAPYKDAYRNKEYFEWNGTYYSMHRSIS